jgi:hypothetical protein
MKLQWLHPFTWMEGLRHATPKMPVSEAAGVTATNFFCGAIIVVANAGNYLDNRTWLLALVLAGLLALIAIPIWRTTWRPARPDPLRQERAAGQLLVSAAKLYARYALTMLSITFVVLVVGWAVTRSLQLAADRTDVHIAINLTTPGIDSFSSFLVFAPGYPIFLFLIGSPIVALLRRVDGHEPALPWAAIREVVPLIPRLFGAFLLALIVVGFLGTTVILLPFAILKAVDWTFAGQEIVFAKRGVRDALSASTKHVRGRWWGVAAVDLALCFVGAVLGPLIGALLIIFTDAPLWTVNLAALVLFGLALPFMMTTLTLMWLDPRTQEEQAPRAWRRLLGRDRSAPVPATDAS